MSEHLVSRLRDIGYCSPKDVEEAADRIEEMEIAFLDIMVTFGWGSRGGAYKDRYFRCLEIAKFQLKYLGVKGNYSNYVKYVDGRKALEKDK